MARLRRPSRRPPKRRPKPRVIVVTEGEKTEPHYIYEFLRIHGLANVQVEPTGFDPNAVVERAIELKRAANATRRGAARVRVWAVFDRDDHPRFEQAQQLARRSDIRVAASNPCFELWAVFHYRDHAAPIGTRDCQRLLAKLCGGYRVDRGKLFTDTDVIGNQYGAAVERGKRSLRERERDRRRARKPFHVDALVDGEHPGDGREIAFVSGVGASLRLPAAWTDRRRATAEAKPLGLATRYLRHSRCYGAKSVTLVRSVPCSIPCSTPCSVTLHGERADIPVGR